MTGKLVWADDAYDLDYASDGQSRFGSYLRQRAHLYDGERLGAVAYVVAVWGIANSPVMVPGYVRLGPLVESVRCWQSEEADVLVASVETRLRWPGSLRCDPVLRAWASWSRSKEWSGEEARLLEPPDVRPALLASAELRLPIKAAELPDSRAEVRDVRAAKRAVHELCRLVNELATPVLARLHEAQSVGVR
jgi:hypothetical protein